MFAFFILGVVFLLIICVLWTAIEHFRLGVPFIPTPKPVIQEMIDLARMNGDETVVDLGAGDARFCIIAKRRYPHTRVIGYEVVPTVWLLGKIRIWLSGEDIEWKMEDAMTADLSSVNVIFLYVASEMMARLEKKFKQELKMGTKIVSHVFRLRDKIRIREKVVRCNHQDKTIIMYEW
ncbi:MAG: hypothetical protein JWM56_1238 [Candidatus Peribacteria bacterium]|nr:hypothetical protein [Candidatus Peribacteria bacterium]